jgi:CBS domain-containing protein
MEVEMKVKDAMMGSVRTCRPADTLTAPAELMWNNDIGCVPVVDGPEGRVVGMITDRDISMAAYTQGRSLSAIAVRDVMATKVHCAKPDDTLHDAEKLMRAAQVHRLPVVAPDGRLVGMVTLNDIARFHAHPLAAKSPDITAEEVALTLAAINAPRAKAAPLARPPVAAAKKEENGHRPVPTR